MELFAELTTADRMALGLLSFIALIIWCRWRGIPQDQGEGQNGQAENVD